VLKTREGLSGRGGWGRHVGHRGLNSVFLEILYFIMWNAIDSHLGKKCNHS